MTNLTPRQLGILLGLFAFVGLSAVSLVFHASKTKIADNQRAAVLQNLQQVLPPDFYDNDIVNDTLEVSDSRLGTSAKTKIYRARLHNQSVAVVIETLAPEGYSGTIALLVAIKKSGELLGVRVISHQETAGLGDKIESERSDWLTQFAGKSLILPVLARWTVKKDGGDFDQLTGATITPRAVVKAVKNTLLYYQAHQAEVFTPQK